MAADLVIRLASVDDIPQIGDLMRRSMSELGRRFYTPEQVASALRYIAQVDHEIITDQSYFAVDCSGLVVGCGGWSRRKKLFSGAAHGESHDLGWLDPATDAARIRAFFVHPDWARRGIGRRILECCERDAGLAGFQRLALMATLPGEPLYAACRFQVVERVDIELPDGMRLAGVRMEKQITAAGSEPRPLMR